MQVSLCLLTWNEYDGCLLDVPQINKDDFVEVIAIDGGSKDGTVEYLISQGIKVYQQEAKGLNGAYIEAQRRSIGDSIVVFFPKGTTPVADINSVTQGLAAGHDLVIASRQIKGSTNEEDTKFLKPRKWAVRLMAIFVGLIWKNSKSPLILDVLHGFKGWRKPSFEKMRILPYGLSIDLEMVVRAYKLNLNVLEVPTSEKSRFYGESNFKFWSTGVKLLNYIVFELRRGTD
jgi:glycosyltransferase involved in cell wall biosynthesis